MPENTTLRPNEGWYEFIIQPSGTTHVGHVYESGRYHSLTSSIDEFVEAFNAGRAWKLVREDDLQGQPFVGIYKDTVTGELWTVNKRGKWTWMNGHVFSHVPFDRLVRVADAFEQL
ncbi:hypothetical protein SEA_GANTCHERGOBLIN_75 [Arthrobacter phage GantcherGoblin]|nr:hypothetical protein SEA_GANTCHERGOBLIN_75 [Arthrobacter phage GantcherGoblin]